MKNYSNRSGMLMIFRAMIVSAIGLVVCFAGYKMLKPAPKIQEYTLKRVDKDLGDICFQTGPRGNIIRVC